MTRLPVAATVCGMLLGGLAGPALADDGPVPDAALAAAIRGALHLDEKAALDDDKLKSLFVLDVAGKDVAALSVLERCPNLASLRVSKGRVSDLAPLKGLKSLQSLDLSGNAIVDLGPLADLAGLQYLNVADNRVEALGPLAGLAALNALDASGNKIADLAPVGKLARLNSLYLGKNQIKALEPLAGLKRLTTLNLSDNQVEDPGPLGALGDLTLVVLERNKVADLAPLVASAKGGPGRWAFARLYLAGNPLSEAAKGEQVAALRSLGVRVEP